jgi:hypothetical protein
MRRRSVGDADVLGRALRRGLLEWGPPGEWARASGDVTRRRCVRARSRARSRRGAAAPIKRRRLVAGATRAQPAPQPPTLQLASRISLRYIFFFFLQVRALLGFVSGHGKLNGRTLLKTFLLSLQQIKIKGETLNYFASFEPLAPNSLLLLMK